MNKVLQYIVDGFAACARAENPAAEIEAARNAEAPGPLNKDSPADAKPADVLDLTPLRSP